MNAPSQTPSAPVLAYPLGDALYLNVTSRCTLACIFCPKIRDRDFTLGGFDLALREDPTADEVWQAALRAGIAGRSEVVFTGFGEPTRRLEVVLDLIRRLKAAGVGRVRLDTDGLAACARGATCRPSWRRRAGRGLGLSQRRRRGHLCKGLPEPPWREGIRGRAGLHPER